MLKLSVLDQSPVRRGGTPAQAIRETLELAKHADRLGYHRYWLAEHHSSGGLASATPEVLIAEVAARTERIRVGSGGVMLSHYSPLKVAESFRMLEAIHPGRIDLGVGRAPGSDGRTAEALADSRGRLSLEHYPEQLEDLYSFLSGDFPPGHPYASIRAMPSGETMPELWMLGSSPASGQYAAELGWAFCFAHFINPEGGEAIAHRYRANFQPSPALEKPKVSIGLSVTCAETDEEAERLSWSRWAWRLSSQKGLREGIPSPEDAMAMELTESERDFIAFTRSRSIFGSPGHVRDRIEEAAAAYGAEEVVLVTITYDFAARVRSYELLAREFGLGEG